ncbi:MAG TPA: hypothetical protein VFL82_15045, partial [Thermomicrobiales bacterium]|nr:hypothetical protein [Thermomicrobiales bacterium]
MSETRELKRPEHSTWRRVGPPHGRANVDSDQAPVPPMHPFAARGASVLPSGAADILALQRSVGNKAVQRLLAGRGHGGAPSAPDMGHLQRKIALNSAQLSGQLSWRGKLNRSTASQIVTTIEEYQRAKTPLRELQLLVAAVKLIDRWLARAGADLSADQKQREATLRTMRADAKNEIDRLRITVMQTELGLPPAFAQSIPLADLHCIASANSALLDGDVAGADAALQQMQSPPAQAAKGLIKQILLRKHIGVVNAKLAKVMDDPTAKYRHKGYGKSLMQGSAKAEDVTQSKAPEHIEHVTPGEQEFEKKKGHVPSDVTEGELQGIAAYTTNAYTEFNRPLRSDLGTQNFSKAQVDLTRLTVSGLNKM